MALFVCVIYMFGLMEDKKQLRDGILRLHVVGASNSAEDQAVKLLVRDAVLSELQDVTECAQSKDEALSLAAERMVQLENAANRVLEEKGFADRATVTLAAEEFPTRQYDTFSLPAGVYDSLRVTIGPGGAWCFLGCVWVRRPAMWQIRQPVQAFRTVLVERSLGSRTMRCGFI